MKRIFALLIMICMLLSPLLNVEISADEAGVTYIEVSSCQNNTAVLASDGTVWAWGDNTYGQLGAGSDIKFSSKPLRIEGFENSESIAVGNGYILALKNDGTLWGIGSNLYGLINDSNSTDKFTKATRISALSDIKAVSAGINYAMAVNKDGEVYIWGSYTRKASTRKFPPQKMKDFTNAITVTAQRNNAMAVKEDATIWNFHGEKITVEKVNNIEGIVSICEGIKRTFAADKSGNVWYWSTNAKNSTILKGISGVIELCDAGGLRTIALDNQGNVWEWDNELLVPKKITGIEKVKALSAGDKHVSVLKLDGTVWTWGDNSFGQLGRDTELAGYQIKSLEGLSDIKAVSLSKGYALALKNDGTVWAWGRNSHGQLGIGTNVDSLVPVKIQELNDIIAISAGATHAAALRKDGTLWAWGSNTTGEIGDGTNLSRLKPVQVKGIDNVTAVSAGDGFTVALKASRGLWAWGNSGYAKKDDPSTLDRSLPRRVEGVDSIGSIDAGKDFVMVLKNTKSLWGWGNNAFGQVDGKASEAGEGFSTPKSIGGMTGIIQVSAGKNFVIALRQDGKVHSWGSNEFGQLGVGNIKESSARYLVKGLTDVIQISAGENHCFAIKKDGSVWGWGDNSYGQLGIESPGLVDSPVKIESLAGVKAIYAGSNYSMALMQDNTLKVWGNNKYGELGIGVKDIISNEIPNQVSIGK